MTLSHCLLNHTSLKSWTWFGAEISLKKDFRWPKLPLHNFRMSLRDLQIHLRNMKMCLPWCSCVFGSGGRGASSVTTNFYARSLSIFLPPSWFLFLFDHSWWWPASRRQLAFEDFRMFTRLPGLAGANCPEAGGWGVSVCVKMCSWGGASYKYPAWVSLEASTELQHAASQHTHTSYTHPSAFFIQEHSRSSSIGTYIRNKTCWRTQGLEFF